MSNTYKHKKQRLLKTKFIERRNNLTGRNDSSLGIPLDIWFDDEIHEIWNEFWKGSLRNGNKRRFEAGMKVKNRKSKRAKLKQELLRIA